MRVLRELGDVEEPGDVSRGGTALHRGVRHHPDSGHDPATREAAARPGRGPHEALPRGGPPPPPPQPLGPTQHR